MTVLETQRQTDTERMEEIRTDLKEAKENSAKNLIATIATLVSMLISLGLYLIEHHS